MPPPSSRTLSSTPREKPAPRQNIGGSWNFNRDASDDARNKLEQAHRGGTSTQTNGPVGGNGPYGGGPYGGGYPYPGNGPYGGGPWGGSGPYGGNPNGRNRGGYDADDNETQSPAMREYIYPATDITFMLKDSEADLTDDAARRRVFYTDGRKLQKSKDDNDREITAHWEGNRLVADEKLNGEHLRRSFELSGDGRQLDEEVDLDATRYRSAVTFHYVYDINTNRQ
jgi:hypothetical protein